MALIQLDVYGATKADVPSLEQEFSDICGSPAELEETLGDAGTVLSFVVDLVNTSLPVVAAMFVAHVRARRTRIKIEDIEIDSTLSVEQVILLLEKVMRRLERTSADRR